MTTTPDQPDGIEYDSLDLPDPTRAAERVNTFLDFYGDGLVFGDLFDGHHDDGVEWPPLYARDLQALANLAATQEKVTSND